VDRHPIAMPVQTFTPICIHAPIISFGACPGILSNDVRFHAYMSRTRRGRHSTAYAGSDNN